MTSFIILLILAAALGAASIFWHPTGDAGANKMARAGMRWGGALLAFYAVASTSYVNVGDDQVARFHRVFFGKSMGTNAYIARDGENGPQPFLLGPGFKFWPLVNIIYDVTKDEVVKIPPGRVGLLHAKDGAALRPDQTLADPLHAFKEKGTAKAVELGRMISDTAYFLENGGQKGPQTTVLTPGVYRLNKYLWEVKHSDVLTVPTGFVAVIKSNVHGAVDLGDVLRIEKPDTCDAIHMGDPKKLVAPVVPRGCVGVWKFALPPGQYNLNWGYVADGGAKKEKDAAVTPYAYEVSFVDTRQQAWLYAGGYKRREIKLEVDQQEGKIVQVAVESDIPVPKGAAAAAIAVKAEGWTIRQSVRALVQTTPDNAPFVVASVGSLEAVEDRVVTPALQSLLTDIAGGYIRVPDPADPTKLVTRATHALDFIERREYIEKMLEQRIITEAGKAGVLMQEIRLLETDFPPELLVARKRQQLADQLSQAYREEEKAQIARIKVQRERAIADQQPKLIEAQIFRQAADMLADADIARGKGMRGRLAEEAVGQKAQMEVLGQDKVVQLQMLDRALVYLDKHPEVLTSLFNNAHKLVPNTVVNTQGGGFDLTSAAAAIMGMQPNAAPAKPAEKK